uniref:Thiol:disulfide interchange protein n=1 Tax=Symphyocladiella dendroidea TaxID=2506487 RepID=A0A1Z1M7C8_9FLOR|nr:thiol:disulfide interchange protein [Symphyocladiella dendroidea]ARW61802.1 thiol:disulfide interchange protein [Symphyocladiella dendroidea]
MIIFLSLYDFLDNYYIFFYALQQKLYSLLFVSSNQQSFLLAILLFFLGLITVFTPCFLSLLPLVLSYINSKKNYGLNISLFITGLLTSFFILILCTNLVSFSFFIDKLPVFSYLILIVVALDLMKILSISKLNIPFSQYIFISSADNMFLQSYLMGLVIGSSSLPCNTSIIIVVTFLVNNLNSIFLFSLYLFIYLSGCVFPLLLIVTIEFNYNNFSLFFFIWKSIFPVSGSFLFVFSCLSLLKTIFV